eukprot:5792506-Pyramimonas_sp.AAC.1
MARYTMRSFVFNDLSTWGTHTNDRDGNQKRTALVSPDRGRRLPPRLLTGQFGRRLGMYLPDRIGPPNRSVIRLALG